MALARSYLSPRYYRIDNLERWFDGNAYEGKWPWLNESEKAPPLLERAPCIVYPIAQSAALSNIDLILGEGRFPILTTNPGEDDTAWAEEDGEDSTNAGLNQEDSQFFDRFLNEIYRSSRFRSIAREALLQAHRSGTVCTLFGTRQGAPFAENIPAKWCEPKFDNFGAVMKLVVQYPYYEQYRDQNRGAWKLRVMIYRREIDETLDATMKPQEAQKDGALGPWVKDPEKTVAHGFGFCPVQWWKFMRFTDEAGRIDGHAFHEGILDEMHALDMALSQRQRAAMYAGDPLITETGVDPGYSPTSTGRVAGIQSTKQGGTPGPDNPSNGSYMGPNRSSGTGRKKGPHIVWQYPNDATKVELHSLPGDALTALDNHARDLRAKIAEMLSVVFLEPDTVKFAATLSAKALVVLRDRQTSRCDVIREDAAYGWLIPASSMLLRITYMSAKTHGPERMRVRGLQKAMPLLKNCLMVVSNNGGGAMVSKSVSADASAASEDTTEWVPPLITIRWPGYYKPDVEEELKKITAASVAKKEGLATTRSCVEYLKGVIPVESIDQVTSQLRMEAVPIDTLIKALQQNVESPTFQREARRQLARGVVSGAPADITEKIDREIDAIPDTQLKAPPPPAEQMAQEQELQMAKAEKKPASGDTVGQRNQKQTAMAMK